MKCRIAFVLCGALFWSCVTGVKSASEFQADGAIVSGDYQVMLKSDGVIRLNDPEGNVFDFFVPFSYATGGKGTAPMLGKLRNAKLEVSPEKKLTQFSALAEPPGHEPIPVTYEVGVTDEGHVRIALRFDLKEPGSKFVPATLRMHVSRQAVVGGTVKAGSFEFPIKEAPPTDSAESLAHFTTPTAVTLNSGQPAKQVSFLPQSECGVTIIDHNTVTYRPPFFDINFEPRGNEMILDIQLPEVKQEARSDDTYGGVDFWKVDQLHLPQYSGSKNLVPNPGFEGGFNYWRWNSFGSIDQDEKHDSYDVISTENPQSGNRCLAIRGEPGISPAEVSSFAIPVDKGVEYTLSFYARGDSGQRLTMNVQGIWGKEGTILGKSIALTSEWTRYSFTFKTPQNYLYFGFGNHNAPADGWLYIDSVQLEKGAQASEYTTRNIMAWVESVNRGNMWQPGTDPKATLRLSGKPGAAGKVRVTETDFFGTDTNRGELSFHLDARGEASLPLPWAASLPMGTHVITMDVTAEGGFKGKDYGRFTVLRFLENKHAQKNIFSTPIGPRWPEWARYIEFFKHVGIGSAILFDPASHGFHALLDQNGILRLSSILDGGQGYKSLGWNQHDKGAFDNLTPEKLKAMEEEAYKKALAYPEVKYWKVNNEPDTRPFIDNVPQMNKMVDVLLALRRGVLRANSSAQIIGSDPANMYANSGVAFVNTQLQAIGDRKVFDIAAIHPYRTRPEQPDLDFETGQFIKMLNSHGFKGEVWFTEGIYHQNYDIPSWGLDAHKGCSSDHYRAGAVSYAMGWGEHMAAAYAARSWLVGLKYGDRVRMYMDWGFSNNSFEDINLTPHALVFAANTLGNILGNATYKQDLSLGYEVHCYIFEDEQKRPVAAIWYSNINSDLGKVKGPDLDVSTLAAAFPKTEYADFMGNRHPLGSTVGIGPFPIFIYGEKNGLAAFTAKLGDAMLAGSSGDFHVYLSQKSASEIQVNVENQRGKEFKGEFRLLNGKDVVAGGPLVVPPNGTWTQVCAQKARDGVMNSMALTLEIKAGSASPMTFDLNKSWMLWPKRKNPITLSGNLKEWEQAYQMDISNQIEYPPNTAKWKGPQDLSARMYATWDETSLYLAFKVQDDVFHPAKDATAAWKGDSLQLYFDGWADATKSRLLGYGPDDQSFMIWPNPPGGSVYRDTPPERQLAFLDTGLVKNASLVVHKTADGLVYEMTIPVADLAPVKLAAFEKFGFAALVNDHDGDYRKRALTLTPEKTEPFQRPDLYPTVILVP